MRHHSNKRGLLAACAAVALVAPACDRDPYDDDYDEGLETAPRTAAAGDDLGAAGRGGYTADTEAFGVQERPMGAPVEASAPRPFGEQESRSDLDPSSEQRSAEQTIQSWPATSQEAARATIEAYGEPAEVTKTRLVWHGTGPWKRTVVHSEVVQHDFPMPHEDVLEQCVDLAVPVDKLEELGAYDGSVIVDRTKGEICARCDKEAMNFLALNLANRIIAGEIGVDEARAEYARVAMAFKEGEEDELTRGLNFEPQADSGDPDKPFEGEAEAQPAEGEVPEEIRAETTEPPEVPEEEPQELPPL